MLYNRIIKQGTINEPEGKSEPQFALASTVNWMRALTIIVEKNCINFCTASSFYMQQARRKMDVKEENSVLEQLFLGLHHLSALDQFRAGATAADYARVGVLTWYYGIANAASAMTAAQSGSFMEDHAGTARLWDEQIASRGLAIAPFSWRVSSLVEATYRAEVDELRSAGNGNLKIRPNTYEDALGAAAGYLSGSASWYARRVQNDLINSGEFKNLGVKDFRTTRAKALRDERLSRKSVGFVHQAARYRGKANYRDALFLAYGSNTETILSGYIEDTHSVLKAFVAMAGAFARRKLGKDLWSEFIADVDTKKAFTAKASHIWS